MVITFETITGTCNFSPTVKRGSRINTARHSGLHCHFPEEEVMPKPHFIKKWSIYLCIFSTLNISIQYKHSITYYWITEKDWNLIKIKIWTQAVQPSSSFSAWLWQSHTSVQCPESSPKFTWAALVLDPPAASCFHLAEHKGLVHLWLKLIF